MTSCFKSVFSCKERKEQISVVCWACLRGCGENLSAWIKLIPWQEKGGGGDTWRCTGIRFGWLIENLIRENRIADISASKTEEVSIDLSLLEKE